MKGLVFDIKRFAVHDGPGIRTTVFFKGCPLSCRWCHNPESRSDDPQESVKHIVLDGKTYEQEEITGREMTVADVMKEVERDRIFYEESGGGVTLSGGEPLCQPDFCEALLKALKEQGFHTALDTSGYALQEEIRRALPYTDLFLYDLKIMDDDEHFKYTGVSNKQILENLRILSEGKRNVVIRFPVIPEITDLDKNINAITEFLMSLRPHVNNTLTNSPTELHLLPYNALAHNKYRRFQMEDQMEAGMEVSHERLSEITGMFETAGFMVKVGG
jgi:pyruvate formate lyase activating enzyme